MKLHAWRSLAMMFVLCFAATAWSAERAWQQGIWREAQTKRARVVFGIAPHNPNSGAPRTSPPAAQEVRTYVIETDDLRLELRENTTVDAPRIDVLIGQPVTFALEKNNIYIKDADGREHKLSVTKKVARAK
jgi:hypothetical protein